MSENDFTSLLRELMQRVGVSSFNALSRAAGISERQLLRLRRGEVEQMRVDVLLKLSLVLHVSLSELVTTFSATSSDIMGMKLEEVQIAELKKEYERLQLQLNNQQQELRQDFQQSSLQLLESLLLQFPTAAHKAKENPQLPAVNILPLVEKPLSRLLEQWGVEAIASVGASIPYDPRLHQLMEGYAQPGEIVKVRYIGYCQGEKLLYRAKVSTK